ncbi:hypothetical protein CFC21_001382 [Triticum aestivum]|nr:hypothetical protein CFC21_001382 [Triticum aestivum]
MWTESDGGNHQGQEHGHGAATLVPSLTPSLGGVVRLRPPGKGQAPGRRKGLLPPASASKVQPRRNTSSRPPCPSPLSRSYTVTKHKNKSKALLASGTSSISQVDAPCDTSAPMDEDADHVILSDDEDGQEEEVEEVNEAGKRKLTSKVWLEMKKMRINGQWKAKCNYCHKELAPGPRAGTKHLASHLKICTLKMLKMK